MFLRKVSASAALIGLIFCADAYSAVNTTSTKGVSSHRVDRRITLGLGINNPAPSVLSVNAGYNVTDYLKATAGYGQIEATTSLSFDNNGNMSTQKATATTYGVGVQAMVPKWNVTPVLGINYAKINYSGTGKIEVGGFKESGSHAYSNIGIDWQGDSGMNLSLGYNLSFKSGVENAYYANAGWAFDWLN